MNHPVFSRPTARVVWLLILAVGVSGAVGCARCGSAPRDTLTQYSTIDALLAGVYDGEHTVAQVRAEGDFGIGTFDGLDGEMIVLDGVVYRVAMDGVARVVSDDEETPFMSVSIFEPEFVAPLKAGLDYDALQTALDARLRSPNLIHAIRIEGVFDYMKTRSVPRQEPPYPPLAEVVEGQAIFEFRGVRGTLVGYYTPEFAKGVGVPGYHLHFLTEGRKAGGHVLALTLGDDARAQIDPLRVFTVVLPDTTSFGATDLGADRSEALHKVERAKPEQKK